MVIIKREKKQQNNRKSENLKSKGYSEGIVSGRLHQNSDLEVRNCCNTCKRGPAWSCDVNET